MLTKIALDNPQHLVLVIFIGIYMTDAWKGYWYVLPLRKI